MSTVFWPECAEFFCSAPLSRPNGNRLAKEIAKNFQPVRRNDRERGTRSPETNIKLCYSAGDPKEGIFPPNDFREQGKQKVNPLATLFLSFFRFFL